MKKYDLIKLRRLVTKEYERRKRVNELLQEEHIKEILKLTEVKIEELDISDREILSKILSSFRIKETNGIYVCTSAWYDDCEVGYQMTNFYQRYVEINSNFAEYKVYFDIESGKAVRAVRETTDNKKRAIIADFERENIVLNPTNKCDNMNQYAKVSLDFFETALKSGQAKAKSLVLSKYPRLR